MEKKLYRYRKDSDVWMEAKIPLEYASCHDGIVVLSGTLPQNPFNSGNGITVPEEIDDIPVTELRATCRGVDNIDSAGLKRVNLKILSDSFDGEFYCVPPMLVGGMQDTIEEMRLVYEACDMRVGSFADMEYLYSLSFNGVVHDNQDWDYGSFETGLFRNCTNLRNIHGIMKGYTLTGSTFRNCRSLETIPDLDITQMCDYEFENCSSLKNIHLHNGLTNVGYHCFANCTSLEDIYVPDTVKRIYEGAFLNCSNLETIHLPDSITEISREMFNGCVKLRKLFVPDMVESIGVKAFTGCVSLTDVFIPDGVKIINDEAFLASGLQTIRTPSGLEKLGIRTFAECTSLTKFFMPENISYIGDLCFEGCVALKSMKIPDKAIVGDQVFKGCAGLEKVELPIHLKHDDTVNKLGIAEETEVIWRD